MSLRERYETADYQTQLKAPILRVAIITLIVVAVPVVLNGLAAGQVIQAVLYAALAVSLGIALVMVSRGRYDRAALLTTYGLVVVVAINQILNGYTGESTFSNTVSAILAVYFVVLIFAPRRAATLVQIGALVAMFLVKVAMVVGSGAHLQSSLPLARQLVSPAVVLVIATVLSILLRSIVDRVVADVVGKMAERERHSAWLVELMQDSTEHLQAADGMKERAEETAAAVVEIEGNVHSIGGQVEALGRQYRESESALDSIGTLVDALQNLSQEQSGNITETGAALEEMVASMRSVAKVVESKRESTDTLRQRADQGSEVIDVTRQSFEAVRRHIDAITDMITIIKSISSQTDLLAMNAAIEAAHAGEAGRGFAVVADEVRKLAESSSENASHIEQTLRELIDSIRDTGERLEESGRSFGEIRSESIQVEEAMNEVASSVTELESGSGEILRATGQLTELTGRLTDSVSSVRENQEHARENVRNLGAFVTSVSSSMDEIQHGTRSIRDEMQRIAEMSGELNEFTRSLSGKLNAGS